MIRLYARGQLPVLCRVCYVKVSKCNRYGQNKTTENKFSFVFQLFVQFMSINKNVLQDNMLITFTIYSDSVLSENKS